MNILGVLATHQEVVSCFTDKTSGPAHIGILVRVYDVPDVWADNGVCVIVRDIYIFLPEGLTVI